MQLLLRRVRDTLRLVVLSGALLLFSGSNTVKADSMTVTFNNVTGVGTGSSSTANVSIGSPYNFNTASGAFNWTKNSGSGSLASLFSSTFKTFCVDLNQFVGSGVTYDLTLDIASMPKPGGGMGAPKANQLEILVEGYWTSGAKTDVFLTAFQNTIWKIVFGPTVTTFGGTDGPSGEDAQTNTLAAQMYNYVINFSGTLTDNWTLVGLTSDAKQDQVAIFSSDTIRKQSAVPAPAGAVLVVLGCVSLVGYTQLRRRKANIA